MGSKPVVLDRRYINQRERCFGDNGDIHLWPLNEL